MDLKLATFAFFRLHFDFPTMKANDLIQENNELAASSKRLEALNERLNRENTSLNQQISTLSLDKDAQRARLADLEASLKTKDSQLKESELKLDDALDELDTTRNEVARLSGTETLLNDRYAMLKGENETNQDKIRSLNVELNALREERVSLIDGTFVCNGDPRSLRRGKRDYRVHCDLAGISCIPEYPSSVVLSEKYTPVLCNEAICEAKDYSLNHILEVFKSLRISVVRTSGDVYCVFGKHISMCINESRVSDSIIPTILVDV